MNKAGGVKVIDNEPRPSSGTCLRELVYKIRPCRANDRREFNFIKGPHSY